MTKKVLILAGDSDGNLGDLAIVTATCAMLRRLDPEVQITIPSGCPHRDKENLGVRAIPRGWRGFYALTRAARDADLVICGGGGLFQDDDSLVKMPYWALRLAYLRAISKPIYGLSIGAGPLDYTISRIFARFALRQLDQISVRDHFAQSSLAPLTQKNVEIAPDPAFSLKTAPEIDAQAVLMKSDIPVDDTPLIGVTVRRWFHKSSSVIPYKYAANLGLHKNRGKAEMLKLSRLAATALDEAVEKVQGHVVFLPTYNVGHEADIDVCRDIASKMTSGSKTVLRLEDPCLYKAVTGLLSVLLCGRMHPAILAAAQRTPIVGLAYNPKFLGMFSLIDQDVHCMSIDDFVKKDSWKDLADILLAAIREPSKFRPDISGIEGITQRFVEKIVARSDGDR